MKMKKIFILISVMSCLGLKIQEITAAKMTYFGCIWRTKKVSDLVSTNVPMDVPGYTYVKREGVIIEELTGKVFKWRRKNCRPGVSPDECKCTGKYGCSSKLVLDAVEKEFKARVLPVVKEQKPDAIDQWSDIVDRLWKNAVKAGVDISCESDDPKYAETADQIGDRYQNPIFIAE